MHTGVKLHSSSWCALYAAVQETRTIKEIWRPKFPLKAHWQPSINNTSFSFCFALVNCTESWKIVADMKGVLDFKLESKWVHQFAKLHELSLPFSSCQMGKRHNRHSSHGKNSIWMLITRSLGVLAFLERQKRPKDLHWSAFISTLRWKQKGNLHLQRQVCTSWEKPFLQCTQTHTRTLETKSIILFWQKVSPLMVGSPWNPPLICCFNSFLFLSSSCLSQFLSVVHLHEEWESCTAEKKNAGAAKHVWRNKQATRKLKLKERRKQEIWPQWPRYFFPRPPSPCKVGGDKSEGLLCDIHGGGGYKSEKGVTHQWWGDISSGVANILTWDLTREGKCEQRSHQAQNAVCSNTTSCLFQSSEVTKGETGRFVLFYD